MVSCVIVRAAKLSTVSLGADAAGRGHCVEVDSSKVGSLSGGLDNDGRVNDHAAMVGGFREDAYGWEVGPIDWNEGSGDVVAESCANSFGTVPWHPVALGRGQQVSTIWLPFDISESHLVP